MMRAVILLGLLAFVAAEFSDEPWVEEEDVEEPYDNYRRKRDVGPYEEHVRVKRYDDRVKRSTDYARRPRQVHQYEVHEFTDEGSAPAPPYEEMLAASAEHYHKVYAAPDSRARYAEVSAGPLTFGVPSSHPHAPLSPNAQPHLSVNVAKIQAPLIAASQVVDQSVAADHHRKHHAHGGGHARHGQHHAERGGKSTKGFNTDHHVDKGGKGHKTDELHRKEYEEAAGQKKKHHDRADHKGGHEEEAFGHRGSNFGEKKGHKKGHKTKGYHNKYHKDEFHKEHKFYDDYHKGGEHHRYGKFNAKHASNESGKKKAHHVNAGHDFVERGKKGYSNKGHLDADHKGHNGKSGHEEHHEHHSQHGKKGGKEGGSHWAHAKKN